MSLRREIERVLREIEVKPDDVRLRARLGDLYFKAGEETLAAEAFASVAEAYAADGFALKAIALLKHCQKLAPRVAWLERLGELHRDFELEKEARWYFEEAAEELRKANEVERLEHVLEKLQALHDEL